MKLYSAVINDFRDGDSGTYSLGIFKTKKEAFKEIKKYTIFNYNLFNDFFEERDDDDYMKQNYWFIYKKEYFKERKDKAKDYEEMKKLFLDDLMNFFKMEDICASDYFFYYYVFEHEIDI